MPPYEKGIDECIRAQRSQSFRILWVLGSYFPDTGGAEWSAMANVALLKRRAGNLVVSCTGHGPRVFDGVPIVEAGDDPSNNIKAIVREFQPHKLVVQGLLSKVGLDIGSEMSLPTIYFLRAKTEIDFSYYLQDPRFLVVANSLHMANWFHERWGTSPIIVEPIILPWLFCADRRRPEFILHIGDADVKGARRLHKIAERLPDQRFVVTRSWPALRDGEMWNEHRIQQLKDQDGSSTEFEPRIIQFNHLKNVTVVPSALSPKSLYQRAQLVLMASSWKEPFGRVVVESVLNNIEIIVAPEVTVLTRHELITQVSDGDNFDEWVSAIKLAIERLGERLMLNGVRADVMTLYREDPERALTQKAFGLV